jgi:hypothetical protein
MPVSFVKFHLGVFAPLRETCFSDLRARKLALDIKKDQPPHRNREKNWFKVRCSKFNVPAPHLEPLNLEPFRHPESITDDASVDKSQLLG